MKSERAARAGRTAPPPCSHIFGLNNNYPADTGEWDHTISIAETPEDANEIRFSYCPKCGINLDANRYLSKPSKMVACGEFSGEPQ
jgi:hypothetical protein